MVNKLNRIAVEDLRMVGPPASALAEEVIDVWNGDHPGASSDSSLQELARGLGDAMNAMLFRFTEAQEINFLNLAISEMSPVAKEECREMVTSYTPLHTYDWIGSTIALRDGKAISLLALHYRDPKAAQRGRRNFFGA